MKSDDKWMQLAIAEARNGIGLTSPNPPVGAVIVKNDHLLGKGWHTQAGKPHAEREAIADALRRHTSEDLLGATIYITLEPCSSHGRTPPCTQGIIDAGRVIHIFVHLKIVDGFINDLDLFIYKFVDRIPEHQENEKEQQDKEG